MGKYNCLCRSMNEKKQFHNNVPSIILSVSFIIVSLNASVELIIDISVGDSSKNNRIRFSLINSIQLY